MYLVYSLLLILAVLLSSPWWLLRMMRHGKYRAGIAERLGRVPRRILQDAKRPCIWIHAVSVGEVLAVARLIQRLQDSRPEYRVLISTTTKTGQELARKRFGEANVFYFPIDFGIAIRAYFRALRPELVILAETEFWPNFLRVASLSGAKLAVVNARISDRSFPRYHRFRRLLSRVLAEVDLFCAQTDEDARRLRQIEAPAGRIHVSGNLKFDIQPPPESPLVARLRTAIGAAEAGPVIVAGSTVEGEEQLILGELQGALKEFPSALLILAPRHPERFGEVADMVRRHAVDLIRRSQWNGGIDAGGVFLLDSIGELASVYALADVATVGGSFAPRGGHNILEPAWFSKPIVIGPHYQNFRDIVEQFRRASAVVVAERPIQAAAQLLRDSAEAQQLGRRARAVLDANRGATEKTLQLINSQLKRADAAREAI
jgi:3-deoxy-D-manno-octulosonic-acid transferase